MALCLDNVPIGDRYALIKDKYDPDKYTLLLWSESSGMMLIGCGATPSLAAADCLKDM